MDTHVISEKAWFKSSYSGGGSGSDCVEVVFLADGAALRDSKNPGGSVLRFAADSMGAFLAHIKG
ncbi:DUF397 domain-containing protein [Streptomyces sp. ISL-12]|nr:DUF397 domain-containing protein [Streptomyces sp. ISL-12]